MTKKDFARGFWHIFRSYWTSKEKRFAGGLLAVVISLNFAMVYLVVLINRWYNEFYNALQNYEGALFWPLIGKFTFLALLHIVIAVYAIYLQQLLQIRWRTFLTGRYMDDWLGDEAYYRLQVMKTDMDNPEQRIQDDINQFVGLTLGLLIGVLKQFTTLAAFAVVLWNLSGVLEVPFNGETYHIYGYMLWFSLLYSGVGTWLAHLVGRKLIRLNYDQQRYEADFRYAMTRVRENGESIAFYRGEAAEHTGFIAHFKNVVKNFRGLMRQTKYLNFYANFYGQIAIIAPLILAAPRYFSGAMQLGGLMQTITAFARVQDALSYFVTVYNTVAQLIAVTHRLLGFTGHLEEVRALAPAVARRDGERSELVFAGIHVALPDGRELLSPCSLVLPPGQRLLVTGASGCGKSTLLRLAARLMLPTSGTVDTFWDGVPVKGAEYRSLLALATPEMELYTRLTVRENLIFLLSARGGACEEVYLQELLARVGLSAEVLPRMMGQLSTGMRQRVRLAVVLGTDAEVWLLDEPGLALDEHGRALLLSETRAAAKRGRLILWATNEPEERKAADACFDLTSDTQCRP